MSARVIVLGIQASAARVRCPRPRHGAALLGLMLLLGLLPAADPATARPYRFRTPQFAAPLVLGQHVLTEDERRFIAALPEVRVGVPLPPPRPYEDVSDSGEVTGIHPEMLAHLAATFGLRLRPVVLPDWTSTLEAARERKVDLVMTLGITPQRLEYLEFTLGVTPLPGALFARTGPPDRAASQPPATPAELARARFALERNYLANHFVQRQFPHASILTVNTTGDALAAVADGRADYYLGSLLETTDWLARRPLPGIGIRQLMPYGTGFYHFAVRKDWAPLATILNKGISSLRTQPAQAQAAAAGLPPGLALPVPLALSAAESALLVARPSWRIGAVRGLPLLNDVDARGVHSGIAAEYTEQLARHLGVGIVVMPFDNVGAMLDALREGRVDLVPFLTRTPQRERDFVFSAPYVEMPYMIVARSDAPLYWDLNSLRGRRLALAAQHPLRELLAQRYPDITIVTTPNGNVAMDAVARGEADAAVEVKLFANLRINGDNDGRLRAVAALEDLPAQFHLAASPHSAALIPLVNRVLADLAPAERDRMLRRWVALDLQPAFPWRRHLPLLVVAATALLALAAAAAWWLRRLAREVKARRQSEDRLNDIGATLPCVAFRYLVDGAGELHGIYYSPGASAFLGVEPQPGQPLLALLGPRLRPEHRAAAEEAQRHSLQSGQRFNMTAAYAHPDGRERWLNAQAVATQAKGGLQAWTGFVADITIERDLQARLAHEAETKKLMLASASHELRAPTHTLSLALQSIPPDGLHADQRTALRIAQDAAQTLSQLLNDVLDAARFDNGLVQLHPVAFSLHELLEQLAAAYRSAAAAKGLRFEFGLGPGVPDRVVHDPLRLKQVLVNLLSNAVKYTLHGQVALHVERVAAGGPARLCFSIADTGVGITHEQQQRLFTPFITLEGEPGRPPVPEGSSGLGLAICRRLADLMDGTVELHSTPGLGTQADFTLPLPPAAPEMPADAMPDAAPGAVLVCDDDDTSRVLMVHMLGQRGFDVLEARDGSEALARWRAGGVSALVTDLEMAGMDGLQMIRRLRSEEEEAPPAARTRVIVCAGNPPPPERSGLAPLHDAYVAKPVDIDALVATLAAAGVRGTTVAAATAGA
jgi:two-component system sensor histidine kinase EvgS